MQFGVCLARIGSIILLLLKKLNKSLVEEMQVKVLLEKVSHLSISLVTVITMASADQL